MFVNIQTAIIYYTWQGIEFGRASFLMTIFSLTFLTPLLQFTYRSSAYKFRRIRPKPAGRPRGTSHA